MCVVEDYADLDLASPYRELLKDEIDLWHHAYLPVHGGTVLDVGAGCGETARFYLLHGASRVVAIEGDPDAYERLRKNFSGDPRVIPIHAFLSDIKVDIEGGEDGMVVEWHGSRSERRFRSNRTGSVWMSRFTVTPKFRPLLGNDFPIWHLLAYHRRLLTAIRRR